jgi:arsenate reductase
MPVKDTPKSRILFVCVGNAVRSQMAEGFARAYGFDAIYPSSAGVSPAIRIDPTAVRAMEEIGIDISSGYPKHVLTFESLPFEAVVNISGRPLPEAFTPILREWAVDDPIGRTPDEYRRARDLIQKLTLGLVDEMRSRKQTAKLKPGPLLDRKRRLRQSS